MATFIDTARSFVNDIINRTAERPTGPDVKVGVEVQQEPAQQAEASQEQAEYSQPQPEQAEPEQTQAEPTQVKPMQQAPKQVMQQPVANQSQAGKQNVAPVKGSNPAVVSAVGNTAVKTSSPSPTNVRQARSNSGLQTATASGVNSTVSPAATPNVSATAASGISTAATPTFQKKFSADERTAATASPKPQEPALRTPASEIVEDAIGSSESNMLEGGVSSPIENVEDMNIDPGINYEEDETVDLETADKLSDIAVDRESDDIIEELGPVALIDDFTVINKEPAFGLSKKNRTFVKAKNAKRGRIKNKLSRFSKVNGVAFTGIIFADEELPIHCISVGSDLIEASLRDPDSGLFDLVMSYSDFSDGVQAITLDQALNDIGRFASIINNHDIPATVEKSPVNQRQSVQVRTLRVHGGGGIGIHPTQGKAFNADFDSDTMTVNADPGNVEHYGRATNYLIGIDGNPTTDMDFFLVDEIADSQIKDVIFCMKSLPEAFSWAPNIVDLIFDDYKNLCNSSDKTAALRKLIYKVDEIAPYYSSRKQPSYVTTGRIYKALYDFGRIRRGRSIEQQVSELVETYDFERPDESSHPLVVALIDYVDGVVAGRSPMNFIEFGAFFNKMFADYSSYSDENPNAPAGKNIPYRLVADFCKSIHRTDLLTIGDPIFGINLRGKKPDDPVSMQEVWEITCAAIQTKVLKGSEYLGSHQLSVKTQVQKRILKTLGFPKYDGVNDLQIFADWLFSFINAYNLEMRVLNMSRVAVRNGYRLERYKVHYDGISMEDIDRDLPTALLEVFGDGQVKRILPPSIIVYKKPDKNRQNAGNWIDPALAELTLSSFSMKNRLRFESEPVLDNKGNVVMETVIEKLPNGGKVEKKKAKRQSRKSAAKRRLQQRIVDPYDILFLLADKRTARIGNFSDQWEKATEKNVDIANRILSFEYSRDFQKYMSEMLDLMFQVSPDMFAYFGMESPQQFFNSEHGKNLVKAANRNNVEMYRSELVSMLIEWRLDKASRLNASIEDSYSETMSVPENNSSQKIEELEIAFDKELDLLASASPAWSAIVKELRSDLKTSYFRRLMVGAATIDVSKSEWNLHAEKFWKSEEAKKYGTLVTFLKSDEPYSLKMEVLADIVRFRENFPEITPRNMIGYLAYNPHRLQDGSPYDMENGIQNELDAVMSSIESMSSYKSRIPEEIEAQHAEFMEAIKADPVGFKIYLERFATEKNWAVHVDTITAADAIAAVFDKGMPAAEKVQQQAELNGYFECVSIQRNGGFYTHFEQSDNKVVNSLGADQVTFLDLIRVLSDPEMEIYIYDEFGTAAKEPLSREMLCGGNTIEDVIRYLDDNPRISMQLRRHVLGVSHSEGEGTKSGIKSRAQVNRMNYVNPNEQFDSSNESFEADNFIQYDEVADRVFGLLSDRPRFFASCCLITPSKNNVGRNISERANEVIRYVCNMLADCALSKKLDSSFDVGAFIDEQLGIKEEDILSILLDEVNVTGVELWDEDVAEKEQIAHAIYMTYRSELIECVDLIEDSAEIKRTKFSELDYNSVDFELSSTSVRAFQDVVQAFGGSRTAKMLNIEGAETKRNECLKVYINSRQERYSMEFSIDGIPDVVLVGEEDIQDPTLQKAPNRQQKAIAKFLEIKRETGAEKGNAKFRKYGDDGKNSIIKFDKYTKESIAAAAELRDQVEHAPDRETAIAILANALIEADEELGYIDVDTVFMESDYLNRADLMIGVNSEGYVDQDGRPQPFVIRTMEQLSAALRTRIDDSVIYDMKQEQQIAALDEIVEVVGTDRDPLARSDASIAYDVLIDLPIHGAASHKFSVDRARKARSSSVDRNYTLLVKITNDFARNEQGKAKYKVPSRKAIEKRARNVYYSLGKDMQKAVRGYAMPNMKQKDNGKWELGSDWTNSLDLLGRACDPTTDSNLIPGPQSFVLFDESIDENIELAKKCYKYGITIGIYSESYPSNNFIQDKNGNWISFDGDLIQVGKNLWVIPCFDMKLNGSFAKPIMPAPAQIKVNPSNYTVFFKDTTGEFGPSDAGAVVAQSFADRTSVTLQGKDPQVFSFEDLFPNTIARVDGDFTLKIPSFAEIQKYIVNQYDFEDGSHPEVDVGVLDSDITRRAFNRAVRRYNVLIKEYINRFYTDANEFGFITQNCRPGSIVGFVKVEINDEHIVFAPIIPFPSTADDGSGVSPRRFNILDIGALSIDPNTNSFFFDYEYSGNIDDQVVKYYAGFGDSNKFVVSPNRMRERELENGWSIDGAFYHSAVATRLFSGNQRIITMISSWLAAKFRPEYSYNFGLLAGAFPGDPMFDKVMPDGSVQKVSLKQMLITAPFGKGGLTREDWKNALPNIDRFYEDDGTETSNQINSMVKYLVTRALDFGTINPSILLCSKTENELLEPYITEFETLIKSSYGFEDAWLKFMHAMNPLLVPNGIYGDDSKTLFKIEKRKNGTDPFGTLLCMVPHFHVDNGKPYSVPECVFIAPGFFGDTFSGIKNIQYNSNNRFLDSLNVSDKLTPAEQSLILEHGRSEMSGIKMSSNTVSIASDNIVEKPVDEDEDGRILLHGRYDREILDQSWGNRLALTGHRPQDLWGHTNDAHYDEVANRLKKYCIDNNIDTIISGMALGFDQIGAQVALDLGINLVAAVPLEEQDAIWNDAQKLHYHELLDQADLVVLVSDGKYDKKTGPKKMYNRNKWMIINADQVYALYDEKKSDQKGKGGTRHAVGYARQRHVPLEILDPSKIK